MNTVLHVTSDQPKPFKDLGYWRTDNRRGLRTMLNGLYKSLVGVELRYTVYDGPVKQKWEHNTPGSWGAAEVVPVVRPVKKLPVPKRFLRKFVIPLRGAGDEIHLGTCLAMELAAARRLVKKPADRGEKQITQSRIETILYIAEQARQQGYTDLSDYILSQ